MKYVLGTIATIIGISLLGLMVSVVFFPVNTAQKLVQTAYDAQDQVLNAKNAIYNYEWFKQQKEDIDAGKQKLQDAQSSQSEFEVSAGDRKDWTFEDKGEDSRLRAVSLGLQNNLTQMIADYNARAKMATRNIFENSVLPSYIDALTFIKK